MCVCVCSFCVGALERRKRVSTQSPVPFFPVHLKNLLLKKMLNATFHVNHVNTKKMVPEARITVVDLVLNSPRKEVWPLSTYLTHNYSFVGAFISLQV